MYINRIWLELIHSIFRSYYQTLFYSVYINYYSTSHGLYCLFNKVEFIFLGFFLYLNDLFKIASDKIVWLLGYIINFVIRKNKW